MIFSKLEGNVPYMTQCLGNFRLMTVSMGHEYHRSDTPNVEAMISSVWEGGKWTGVSSCDHILFLLLRDECMSVGCIVSFHSLHAFYKCFYILLVFNKITSDTHKNVYKVNNEDKRNGKKEEMKKERKEERERINEYKPKEGRKY